MHMKQRMECVNPGLCHNVQLWFDCVFMLMRDYYMGGAAGQTELHYCSPQKIFSASPATVDVIYLLMHTWNMCSVAEESPAVVCGCW